MAWHGTSSTLAVRYSCPFVQSSPYYTRYTHIYIEVYILEETNTIRMARMNSHLPYCNFDVCLRRTRIVHLWNFFGLTPVSFALRVESNPSIPYLLTAPMSMVRADASRGVRTGGGGVPNSPLSWVRECVETFAPGGLESELRSMTLIGLPFYGKSKSKRLYAHTVCCLEAANYSTYVGLFCFQISICTLFSDDKEANGSVINRQHGAVRTNEVPTSCCSKCITYDRTRDLQRTQQYSQYRQKRENGKDRQEQPKVFKRFSNVFFSTM